MMFFNEFSREGMMNCSCSCAEGEEDILFSVNAYIEVGFKLVGLGLAVLLLWNEIMKCVDKTEAFVEKRRHPRKKEEDEQEEDHQEDDVYVDALECV